MGAEQTDFAVKTWCAAEQALEHYRNEFAPQEKIYCFLQMQNLTAGQYTIHSHWINPSHEVEQVNDHSFSLKKTQNYTYYAWISFLKNGPFKQMFTGASVDRKYLGRWQVRFLLDGQPVATQTFLLS